MSIFLHFILETKTHPSSLLSLLQFVQYHQRRHCFRQIASAKHGGVHHSSSKMSRWHHHSPVRWSESTRNREHLQHNHQHKSFRILNCLMFIYLWNEIVNWIIQRQQIYTLLWHLIKQAQMKPKLINLTWIYTCIFSHVLE